MATQKKTRKKPEKPGPKQPDRHPILLLPDEAFEHAANGATDSTIRKIYGLNRRDWYNGLEQHAEIRERLLRARNQMFANVESALYRRAMGVLVERETKDGGSFVYEVAPDVAAIKYLLSTQKARDWQAESKLNVNHSGSVDKKAPALEDMTPEEIDLQVQAILNEKAKRAAKESGGVAVEGVGGEAN